MQKKVFTEAERIKIVRLHLDENRTIKSLAEEFSVSVSTISRWVIRYRNSGYFYISNRSVLNTVKCEKSLG